MPFTRRTLLTGSLAAAALPLVPPAVAAPIERFPLWPGPPPGGAGLHVRDEVVRRSAGGPADDIAWPHVATPMLNVVPAPQPNGGAILYIPGGGYARVAVGREGSGIARTFAARGFTVFELLYRLPHDGWAAGADVPLQDAQRAMRLIRSGAARWGIDAARVAAIGFSAGGHLAARLASRPGLATYQPVDAPPTAWRCSPRCRPQRCRRSCISSKPASTACCCERAVRNIPGLAVRAVCLQS